MIAEAGHRLRGDPLLIDHAARNVRSFDSEHAEFLAIKPVVGYEKVTDLLYQLIGQFVNVDLLVNSATLLNRDQPVVPFFTSVLLGFLALDHANEPAESYAAGKHRFFHEQQDIEWIAIISFGLRHEAEVIGEHHAFGKDSLKCENLLVRIEGILVAAALRSLNDDLQ